MIRIAIALVLLWPALVWGADTGGPLFRNLCTQITDPVTNKVLCWEQTPPVALKYWDGSAWVSLTGGSAPSDATYLTLSLNSTLTQERVLTAGNSITFVDTGANGTLTVATAQDIRTSASPTWVAAILTGTSSLTLGTASTNLGAILFKNASNANTLTLTAGTTTANVTFKLPIADGTSGDCLTTDGSGQLSFAATCGAAAGGITSLNAQVGAVQTFANDTNVTISSAANTHTLGWSGTLGLSRGGTAANLSGTGGTSQYLKQSSAGAAITVGTIAAADLPGSFSGFANPTASIGLSAVNGAATTAMRSDAAPALSQAIVPTWTGAHIFQNSVNSTAAVRVNNAAGTVVFDVDTTNIRVGIGTAAPQSLLHLEALNPQLIVRSVGGGNPIISLFPSGAGVDPIVEFYTAAGTRTSFIDGNSTVGLIHDSTLDHRFRTSGTDRVTIVPSGRVGIATTTPLKRLHVGAGADTPVTTLDGIYLTNNGDTGFAIRDSTNNIEFQFAIANAVFAGILLGSVTNHPIVFRTNVIERMRLGPGLQLGTPTGGDQGAGTLNADVGLFVDGVCVPTWTGTTGQIAWGNGTCTQAGTTELTWDNTAGSKRLTLAVPNTAPSYNNSRPLYINATTSGTRTASSPFSATEYILSNSYSGFFVNNTDTSTAPVVQLGDRTSVTGMVRVSEQAGFTGAGIALGGVYQLGSGSISAGERIGVAGYFDASSGSNFNGYGFNGWASARTGTTPGSIISGLFEIFCGAANCGTTGAGIVAQHLETVGTSVTASTGMFVLSSLNGSTGVGAGFTNAFAVGAVYPWTGGYAPVFQVRAASGKTIIGTGSEPGGFDRLLFVGHAAAPSAYIGIESSIVSSGDDVAAISGGITYTGTTGPGIAGDFTAFKTGGNNSAFLTGVNINLSAYTTSATEAHNGIVVNQSNDASTARQFAGILITNTDTGLGWDYGIYYRATNSASGLGTGRLFSVDRLGGVNTVGNYQVVRAAVTLTGVDATITCGAGSAVFRGGILISSTCP